MNINLPLKYQELGQDEMMYLDGGGVGKNWWNSRGAVGGAIDGIIWLVPALKSLNELAKVGKLVKAGRVYIRENINSALKRVWLSALSGVVLGAVNLIIGLAGSSIGSLIAYGLDRADGRNDGYICA